MNSPNDNSTHFGYKTVASDEKADMVRSVFDSVASRYDVMNDLMSAGLHRLWKRYTIDHAAIKPGNVVLDLAGGTGDLAREFSMPACRAT
jgi:demethylmenaquinone methyltransferase/2-methoxy-6-polyprenyl-1,4-benzoquinol methylase